VAAYGSEGAFTGALLVLWGLAGLLTHLWLAGLVPIG
jgi:hypothetical protein